MKTPSHNSPKLPDEMTRGAKAILDENIFNAAQWYILLLALAHPVLAEQGIPVTFVNADVVDLAIWEFSVGQLESKIAPMISAEIRGRLVKVNVDVGDHVKRGQILAEIDAGDFDLSKAMAREDIRRLQALVNVQQLKVVRNKDLVNRNSVNQQALDDVQAQYHALRAELASAHIRLQMAERNIERTHIVSPIDGQVDAKQVSEGDYVGIGSPVVRIRSSNWLNARLPYPESLLSSLHAGLPVLLSSPSTPGITLETTITEVSPSITPGSRAAQVIVSVENPGLWISGATVTGQVQVSVRKEAIVVPEICVVYRPVGTVVYVINGEAVAQRLVTTGLRREGNIEILTGLSAGERVIADGAGFLTDGALVDVKGT